MKQISDVAAGWVERLAAGRLAPLVHAIERFGEAQAAQAAAAMAYYAVFSLFPLLLLVVSATGYFVADELAQQQVIDAVATAIPVSREMIWRNLQTAFEHRQTAGMVGLAGLAWSASGAFAVLGRNINRAWPGAEPRGYVKSRLVGLAMVGVLALLLGLSLASSAALRLLPQVSALVWNRQPFHETLAWRAASSVVPAVFTFLLFAGLYLWAPTVTVSRRAAVWTALIAAIAWEVVKNGFAWYMGSGLAQYELVYGSLAAVVALMLWIYLAASIVLFGAHLAAALSAGASGD